jgi:N-methylhydantoinase B
VVTTLADRAKFPPLGLFGGDAGRVACYSLLAGQSTRQIPSKGSVQVKPGETMRVETCGGGGYGHAFEREPEAVLRDVREGKVSLKRAQDCYGVAIDPMGWTVDEKETTMLRRKGKK